MMKTKIINERGRKQLVIAEADKSADRKVLAAMENYADSACWQLNDVRLAQYVKPSKYSCSVSADTYHASWQPESPAEADLVKSMLREYREDEDGTIRWCSFEGIVRGRPEVNGYRPPSYKDFDQAGYFSHAEALQKLGEIQAFWESFEGDPAKVKIDNPHRQPTESQVMGRVIIWRMENAEELRPKPSSPSL